MLLSGDGWLHDLHLAARSLVRARAFAGTAVLTLALGIAGATVVFALVEGVLLRPLPVHEEERLIVGWKARRSGHFSHWPFARAEIDAIREESRLLEAVAAVGYNGSLPLVAVENGAASYLQCAGVTGRFFEVLGVAPLLGRALRPGDDVPGAEKVLVLTHDLWERRYGGSPAVLGRRLLVSDQPFTVVGVMPPDVAHPRRAEAWMSIATLAATYTNPTFRENVPRELDLVARLRPGIRHEQARAELQGLITALEAQAPPGGARDLVPVVRSYTDAVVGDVRRPMVALFAAVGLVLLIASANVANLLLLRGESRRSELALRTALGAGPGRIARQMLGESLLLAVGAGALGLIVTSWTLPALVALVPDGLPRHESIRIDSGVFLFASVAALLVALLAALPAVLRAVRLDLVSELQAGGTRTASGAQRVRRALVLAQVALAVTIVSGAGLLARSLLRLQAVEMGLAADRLVFVELALPQAKYAPRDTHLRFLQDVVTRLEGAPGIEGATPVSTSPFSGTRGWDAPVFTAEGQDFEGARSNPSLNLEVVYPGYFRTLDVAVLRGRAFASTDRQDAPAVVILSADVAERTWPGQDPIGKRIKFGDPDSEDAWRTVVGLAAPTRYRALDESRATVYVPAEQLIVSARMLVLRSGAPLAVVASAARDRIQALDPAVQVMRIVSLGELRAAPLARPRFNAFLIGLFGVAALLLAAVGLYAVMGAYVRERVPEIGIRMTLGAAPDHVRRHVLGEGLRLAAVGAALGLAGAAAASRLLRSLLFEVQPLDPVATLGAAALLVATSALACYLPARQASRTDPLVVLRRS